MGVVSWSPRGARADLRAASAALRWAARDDAHRKSVIAMWAPTRKVRKVVKESGHRVERWHRASWVAHEFQPAHGSTAMLTAYAHTPTIAAPHPIRLLPTAEYLEGKSCVFCG